MGIYKNIHKFYVEGITDPAEQEKWLKKSDKEKIFYAYVKMRPDGKPFWVGKGYGYRAFSMASRNVYYKYIIEKYGHENLKTTIFAAEDQEKAFAKEIKLTAYFKALGCKLANMTNGGEGTAGLVSPKRGKPLSKEHVAKVSAALRGKKRKPLSQEHKDQISKTITGTKKSVPSPLKGRPSPLRGRPGKKSTEESRKNMKAAKRRTKQRKHFIKLIEENLKDIPYDPRPIYAEEAYRKAN